MADLKKLTNAVLDELVEIEEENGTRQITRREALIMRIVQDAISDEDPAIRSKASAMVLDILDYEGEKQSKAPVKTELLNKKGEKI